MKNQLLAQQVMEVQILEGHNELILTDTEIGELYKCVEILRPFYQLTTTLSGSEYPTFNLILPNVLSCN
jgi:hypothetical protein